MSASDRDTSEIPYTDAYNGERRSLTRSRASYPRAAYPRAAYTSFEPAESRTESRYWLIVGGGPRRVDALAVGGKLAVFSFREEAQDFLMSRAPGDGWRVRESSTGELVCTLYDRSPGFASVALDPLPEAGDRVIDNLVSVGREEFVQRLLARRARSRRVAALSFGASGAGWFQRSWRKGDG